MIAIVSGLPRSGTSLLMQALKAGGLPPLADEARPADDNNPRGYLEYEPVKRMRQDAGWLDQADGHAVKIIAQLLPSLPPRASGTGPAYRIVFMERDIGEVVQSQNRMLERMGRPAGPAAVLQATFAKQLGAVRTHLTTRDDAAVLYLQHREAIEQPAQTFAQVAAFFAEAGVELDADAMAAVVDPALYRERSS